MSLSFSQEKCIFKLTGIKYRQRASLMDKGGDPGRRGIPTHGGGSEGFRYFFPRVIHPLSPIIVRLEWL